MDIQTKNGEILTALAFGETDKAQGSSIIKCRAKNGKIKHIDINLVVCFYGSEILSPDSYTKNSKNDEQ